MGTLSRIGILTGGGDCPGLNAVIRAVAKMALTHLDVEVIGFLDGYEGLVEDRHIRLDRDAVSGILTRGGTILGTSNRSDPFNYPMLEDGEKVYRDRSEQAARNFRQQGLDALVSIGGDGTMTVTQKFAETWDIPVVGVPKTIDNDLMCTDQTFGFDSAMTTATEAVDKIHTTAQSHHRVMVVEVMGRYAGWLALCSGLAGGGDIILIPEIPYRIDAVCEAVKQRRYAGKQFSIVVVGEGAKPEGGEMVVRERIEGSPDPVRLGGIGHRVADEIEAQAGVETRVTVLGHLLRGGIPSPADRLLATRFGVEAMRLLVNGEFGRMAALRGHAITSVSLDEVAGQPRTVPPDSELLDAARAVGTCLGV